MNCLSEACIHPKPPGMDVQTLQVKYYN